MQKRITLKLRKQTKLSAAYNGDHTGTVYMLRSLFLGKRPPRTITLVAENVVRER